MHILTDEEIEVFEYIESYILEFKRPPATWEIRDGCGFSGNKYARNVVHTILGKKLLTETRGREGTARNLTRALWPITLKIVLERQLPSWVSVDELPEEDGVYDTCHVGFQSYRYLQYQAEGGWFSELTHWRKPTEIPPRPETES